MNGKAPSLELFTSLGLYTWLTVSISFKPRAASGSSIWPHTGSKYSDALININGTEIYFLPILMTLINIASATIYMQGFSFKSKIQMYAMALVFLVFLYGSPAGLVFYWTLNNVFSLAKNVFYKLKNPALILSLFSSATGLFLLYLVLTTFTVEPILKKVLLIFLLLAMQLPLLVYVLKKKCSIAKECKEEKSSVYLCSCMFLAVLTGILIPSAVIRSSTSEFIDITAIKSPLWYVLNSGLLAAGTFLIWLGIFYSLASNKGKRVMSVAVFAISGTAAVDYMFFGTKYGNISALLKYDRTMILTGKEMLFNLSLVLSVMLILFLLWKYKRELSSVISTAMCFAVILMSSINIFSINKETAEIKLNSTTMAQESSGEMPKFALSRTGKNVVVIMLDRAYSGFVPFILQEKPELMSALDGFTYYPNTLSLGSNTYSASAAVFGGYEYAPTPNNDSSTGWIDNQNEALQVMPRLFSENGFETYVIEPPLANGKYYSDLTIYSDYPLVHTYSTRGKFLAGENDSKTERDKILNRNFFCYSVFRIAPVFCQITLYNNGMYNEASELGNSYPLQIVTSPSTAYGMDTEFMNAYDALKNLDTMTIVDDSEFGGFLMLYNETSHENRLLQKPAYVPAVTVDNAEYDADHPNMVSIDGRTLSTNDEIIITHYHSSMASFLRLTEWFDFLRENDVYNNTKIILVSDHGFAFDEAEKFSTDEAFWPQVTAFNPILLIKDYDSKGFTIDNILMTNADVPALALKDCIENPYNPFTGKMITSERKSDKLFISGGTSVDSWESSMGYFFQGDTIFDRDNWASVVR